MGSFQRTTYVSMQDKKLILDIEFIPSIDNNIYVPLEKIQHEALKMNHILNRLYFCVLIVKLVTKSMSSTSSVSGENIP